MKNKIGLAIHGGAGALRPGTYTEEEMKQYMSVLKECRQWGSEKLRQGGHALEVVSGVVCRLEDCPLFNAGIGSVYNSASFQEMDAAIMDGKSMRVGAVAAVTQIKNPILGAGLVLRNSPHSLIAGEGAHQFLQTEGMELVDQKIFRSEKRLAQLESARKKGKSQLDHSDKMGTVGCVALDENGNLASATSTGGMTNKHPGRISDSCIIGAGTYAENGVVAISGTGTGDQFISGVLAFDLASLIKYKNLSLESAATKTLEKLNHLGGSGGFALINSEGEIHLPFNTTGMFRAWWSLNGSAGESVYT